MQDFHPTPAFYSLLVKAAFLLGLLNLSGWVLIEASQRQGGPSAAHPSPWVCVKGGIREASACVAAIVYKGTRGWLNNPPVNTAIQWETRKWQDPRDSHTHMPFPWSWRDGLIWEIRGGKRGDREGSLLATAADLWMDTRKRRRRMKSLWAKKGQETKSKSKRDVSSRG